MIVELDKWERLHAATVGGWRSFANAARPNAHGFIGDGYRIDVIGALCEYAVAKGLNLFWSGVRVNPFILPGDVGVLQVRGATDPAYRLIVHDCDRDDAVFVLVIGDDRRSSFDIIGWIVASDAKRVEWYSDPSGKQRPAYFVPRTALHPIDTLVRA